MLRLRQGPLGGAPQGALFPRYPVSYTHLLHVQGEASADALYLWKAYIREDEGGSYVMKAGVDNRLYKQYLELGATIYSGEYVEVKSGLTAEDYIAFPYGTDVQEGVRAVVEGTEDPPHPEEDGSENIAVGSSQEEDNLEEDTSSALAPDGPVLLSLIHI